MNYTKKVNGSLIGIGGNPFTLMGAFSETCKKARIQKRMDRPSAY